MAALTVLAALQALALIGVGLAAIFGKSSGWTSIDDLARWVGLVAIILGMLSTIGAYVLRERPVLGGLLVVPGTLALVSMIALLR